MPGAGSTSWLIFADMVREGVGNSVGTRKALLGVALQQNATGDGSARMLRVTEAGIEEWARFSEALFRR